MNYLYAAYGMTFLIHAVYLITLWRGFARVKQESQELDRQR